MKSISFYNLINGSYRDYIRSGETLRTLNVIIMSAAMGTLLFAISGGAAFAGFASDLGAGEFEFGLITALPVLAGLLQFLVSYLVEKTGKRKRLFMIGGIIQRLCWIAVAFIPYIVSVEKSRVYMLVVLVTLAAMGGSFTAISHMSLMASVIPMDIRGRYITTRQRICTLSSLASGLCAALLLDRIPGFLGYTIIFAVGGIAGLVDILMYFKVKFPETKQNGLKVSLLKITAECFSVKKTRDYMLFWICWSFAVNLCSPFFNKYAIDILSLSYMQITIFGQVTANILSMLIVRRWGVSIDRYGGAPTLLISTLFSSLCIAVWLIAVPGSVLPLFIFNIVGGLCWCANDACMVNMQLSHTPDIGRPVALAVYAMGTSISTAVALIVGGSMLEALSPVMKKLSLSMFGTPFDHYKLVFCISIVLRILVVTILLPRVWNEKGFALREAFKQMYHDIRSRVKYIKAQLRLPKI